MRGKLHCYLERLGRTLCRGFVLGAVLLSPHLVLSQNLRTVTGTVLSSEDNSPIPGVSIVVKNTSTGTVTDVDGRYSLNVSDNSVLVFSFVGFAGQEIEVGGRSTIDVTMAPQTSTLQEVVVTGYSTQRKQDITGSVSVVDMKDYQKTFRARRKKRLRAWRRG